MKLPKVSLPYKLFVPLFSLFIILSLCFPRQAKFAYDYKKGSAWNHETLIAQFDFPILKTQEQLRQDSLKFWQLLPARLELHILIWLQKELGRQQKQKDVS